MFKKILLALLLIVLLGLAAGYYYYQKLQPPPPPISAKDRAAIQLMPLPAELKLNNGKFIVDERFGLKTEGYSEARLERAKKRFLNRLSKQTKTSFDKSKPSKFLTIHCQAGASEIPQLREDESYDLVISPTTASLKAASPYGILRGLETFLQLVENQDDTFSLPACSIRDKARFPWRGILIDACRHWMPKEVILRNLDGMAALKMNVLHWHLSEDQGFRVESKVFPKLQEMGSDGKYYSQQDVKEIIAYAADRGIRVVPEFDLPGHSTSWFVGYPELASAAGPFQITVKSGDRRSVMDPSREAVYNFLDRFFGEMAALFPDPYMHIGGDEVNPKDWNENEHIQAFMKEKGFKGPAELQVYFNQRLQKILAKHGKEMVGWDEILQPDLPKETVVQSWRGQKSLFEAVQAGHFGILSAGWYLDHKLPAGKHYAVDPLILPGGVTIEPDNLHWKTWDLTLNIQGNETKTAMTLFGEKKALRGVFKMADNLNSFDSATLEGNKLRFDFLSSFGKVHFDATLTGDAISGTMGLGFLKFDFDGKRTGGNDMPGTKPPEFERIKALTAEDKSRILGGEACMWSEVVDSVTIDSRIYPRVGAIAEKLWSPQALTNDTEDFYRRLRAISKYLSLQGVTHESAYLPQLERLANGAPIQPLKTLVDVLEEVKYYDRMRTFERYSTKIPLNGVVDAARPESFPARNFNRKVDAFLADSTHRQFREELKKQLTLWRANHEKLLPALQNSEQLKKIEGLSEKFSLVAEAGLQAMDAITNGVPFSEEKQTQNLALLEEAAKPQAGMLLQVVPGIRRLVESAGTAQASKTSAAKTK